MPSFVLLYYSFLRSSVYVSRLSLLFFVVFFRLFSSSCLASVWILGRSLHFTFGCLSFQRLSFHPSFDLHCFLFPFNCSVLGYFASLTSSFAFVFVTALLLLLFAFSSFLLFSSCSSSGYSVLLFTLLPLSLGSSCVILCIPSITIQLLSPFLELFCVWSHFSPLTPLLFPIQSPGA